MSSVEDKFSHILSSVEDKCGLRDDLFRSLRPVTMVQNKEF